MEWFDGSITSVKGIRASGVACGLKKNGEPDLALIVSERPATAAGVFTRNLVKGHSLQLTMKRISKGQCQALVINSGNANACLGEAGLSDARTMASLAASQIDCAPELVLVGSTGVIGQPLDMQAVRDGIEAAARSLGDSAEHGHQAERAIMTTDLVPKEAVIRFQIGSNTVTVAGMAKGSGMIHPNMATMIGVIAMDCAVSQPVLSEMLRRVSDKTFNRVSVDGDTSVCDMVIALANGLSSSTLIQSGTAEADLLEKALERVCTRLAKGIAADGEGASRLIEIRAEGLRTQRDALLIVSAVARSPLVKTMMAGGDANWGRIFTAAGYSGAAFDPDGCDIYLGSVKVCERGTALAFDEAKAAEALAQKEIQIRLAFREGDAAERIWTCDLTDEYVRINGSYRS
ncbi:MAG: bifunctional glutamate N-acetyltransferase/amino-acid acetyltransferase ArgJ [Eubacteriales bacterium]|nr:bifunctional glutamate N-acetyltransferase/amino-acid acetyltransferase ArgJ [Eubacteriales bacterium]MDD4461595.1 bifunctional glutamate N-acetyltransferase/amino-acid acetyltransferase ArgJ [Eubacteriales bacterium]